MPTDGRSGRPWATPPGRGCTGSATSSASPARTRRHSRTPPPPAGRTTSTIRAGPHELLEALDSTWRLIEGCLDRWTPEMLAETFHRDYNGQAQVHTRGSILQRLFTHDAYTAASCRRRSASTGCRRSTSGVPIEDLYAVSWSVRKMTSGARLAFTWHVVPSGHPAQERVSTQSAGPGSPVFVRCNLRLRGWE